MIIIGTLEYDEYDEIKYGAKILKLTKQYNFVEWYHNYNCEIAKISVNTIIAYSNEQFERQDVIEYYKKKYN